MGDIEHEATVSTTSYQVPSPLQSLVCGIDHIAIAVSDLNAALGWYRDILGFKVVQRRATEGMRTGMVSVVLEAGDIVFVLIQGIGPESQVTRYIEKFGPGAQHLALAVRDLEACVETLRGAGAEFCTSIIEGKGIRQAFLKRDDVSGMMYELIERIEPDGCFTDESVKQLFLQLEANNEF